MLRSSDNRSLVALLTDFGYFDGYAGQLRGILAPSLRVKAVVDITHGIEKFNIKQGRWVLYNSYRSFPENTCFLCVVDPGVATARKIILIRSAERYFLGPDNGLMDWAAAGDTQVYYLPDDISSTFQAREIMAPFLRKFIEGKIDITWEKRKFNGLKIIKNNSGISQYEILHEDHYGNLITNISTEITLGSLEYNGKTFYKIDNYSEKSNEKRLIRGSSGLWEIAGL